MKLALGLSAVAFAATLTDAADFTGKIKRIRIKKRRTGSGFRILPGTQTVVDPPGVDVAEVQCRLPEIDDEVLVATQDPESPPTYSLFIPGAEGEVVKGEAYKIELTMVNEEGKATGPTTTFSSAYDLAGGEIAQEDGLTLGPVSSEFDVFDDVLQVSMTEASDTLCPSCIVVEVGTSSDVDADTAAKLPIRRWTHVAVSSESRVFSGTSKFTTLDESWFSDVSDAANEKLSAGQDAVVKTMLLGSDGQTLLEDGVTVTVEDDDDDDGGGGGGGGGAGLEARVRYAKKRIRQNSVRRLRNRVIITSNDDADDLFDISSVSLQILSGDSQPQPLDNPLLDDVRDGFQFAFKNEAGDVEPGVFFSKLTVEALNEDGVPASDPVTFEGAFDIGAGEQVDTDGGVLVYRRDKASRQLQDAVDRQLQFVDDDDDFIVWDVLGVAQNSGLSPGCPSCVTVDLSPARGFEEVALASGPPAHIRVAAESADGLAKIYGTASKPASLRSFSAPRGVLFDDNFFGGEELEIAETVLLNANNEKLDVDFFDTNGGRVVVQNFDEAPKKVNILAAGEEIVGDVAVDDGELLVVRGSVDGSIYLAPGSQLQLDGSKCSGDVHVTGGAHLEIGNHNGGGGILIYVEDDDDDSGVFTWLLSDGNSASFGGDLLAEAPKSGLSVDGNLTFAGRANVKVKRLDMASPALAFTEPSGDGVESTFETTGGNMRFANGTWYDRHGGCLLTTHVCHFLTAPGGNISTGLGSTIRVEGLADFQIAGGDFVASDDSILDFGESTFNVAGGSIMLRDSTRLSVSGGQQLTINGGNFEASDSAQMSLIDTDGAIEGGSFFMTDNAKMTVRGGHLLTVTGGNFGLSDQSEVVFSDSSLNVNGGSVVFHDDSRMTVGGGSLLTVNGGDFSMSNSADLDFGSATIQVSGGNFEVQDTSTFVTAQGSQININGGDFKFSGESSISLDGGGAILVSDGSISGSDSSSLVVSGPTSIKVDRGNCTGRGVCRFGACFALAGGAGDGEDNDCDLVVGGGNIDFSDQASLDIGDSSQLSVSGGSVLFSGSSTVTFDADATLNVSNGNLSFTGSSHASLKENYDFTVSGGNVTVDDAAVFSAAGDGALTVDKGNITIGGSLFGTGGSMQVLVENDGDRAATLALSGRVTAGGDATFKTRGDNAPLTLDGASLSVADGGGAAEISTNGLAANLTVRGTLDFSGSSLLLKSFGSQSPVNVSGTSIIFKCDSLSFASNGAGSPLDIGAGVGAFASSGDASSSSVDLATKGSDSSIFVGDEAKHAFEGSVSAQTKGDDSSIFVESELEVAGDLSLTVSGNGGAVYVHRSVAAGGAFDVQAKKAGGSFTAPCDLESEKGICLFSGAKVTVQTSSSTIISGSVSAEGDVSLSSGESLSVSGDVSAASGDIEVSSGSAMEIEGSVSSSGPVSVTSGSDLRLAGAVASDAEAIVHSDGAATIEGSVSSKGSVKIASDGDLTLVCDVKASQDVHIVCDSSAKMQVALEAVAGELLVEVENDLAFSGAAQANGGVDLEAGESMEVVGVIGSSAGDITLDAGSDISISGTVSAGAGEIELSAGNGATLNLVAPSVFLFPAFGDPEGGTTVAAVLQDVSSSQISQLFAEGTVLGKETKNRKFRSESSIPFTFS